MVMWSGQRVPRVVQIIDEAFRADEYARAMFMASREDYHAWCDEQELDSRLMVAAQQSRVEYQDWETER